VPPKLEGNAPSGFLQLFWTQGDNLIRSECVHADMWEHDPIKIYRELVNVNPSGFIYTKGLARADARLHRNNGGKPAAAEKGEQPERIGARWVAGTGCTDGNERGMWLRANLGISMLIGGITLIRSRRRKPWLGMLGRRLQLRSGIVLAAAYAIAQSAKAGGAAMDAI
jgi:hypothetical protein